MPTLRFSSKAQFLLVPLDAELADIELDGLRIREEAEPAAEVGLPPATRRYPLVIEADVENLEESSRARHSAHLLVSDLERVWPYAAGLPLHPPRLHVEIEYAPAGWTSTVEDVEDALRREEQGLTGRLEIVTKHWL